MIRNKRIIVEVIRCAATFGFFFLTAGQPILASDAPIASPGVQVDQVKTNREDPINELELQALVMGMADQYVSVISEIVYLQLRPKAKTSNERVLAQSFMRNSFGAAAEIAAGPNPDIALLDLLVLVSLQRHVFETHWLPNVWGGRRGREALSRLAALERDTWAQSRRLLSADQHDVLQRLIVEWTKNNPDRVVVELTRFGEFASARHMPNLSDREKATGLLSDVGNAVTAIDDALLFGERAMWYAGRLSYILGEQTELTAYRVMAAPEVQRALTTLQGFEEAATKLSEATNDFPNLLKAEQDRMFLQLRSERQAAIQQMDEVFREALENALKELVDDVKVEREAVINHFFGRLATERQETLKSISNGSDKIAAVIGPTRELVKASTELARLTNETTATIERIAGSFGVSGNDGMAPEGNNERLAEALNLASASQALIVQLQALLQMPELDQNLSRTESLTKFLLGRVFLYLGGLIILIFAGLVVLRFVPKRL